LVRACDAASLAEGIRQVVEDRSFRLRLIATAAEEVRFRYSWDLVLKQYQKVLGL
jgi:glycosyltransferase involved in cell wall biosynthesis